MYYVHELEQDMFVEPKMFSLEYMLDTCLLSSLETNLTQALLKKTCIYCDISDTIYANICCKERRAMKCSQDSFGETSLAVQIEQVCRWILLIVAKQNNFSSFKTICKSEFPFFPTTQNSALLFQD